MYTIWLCILLVVKACIIHIQLFPHRHTILFPCITHLKALYAEEAEVLVQFTPCQLRLVEVLFQIYLYLLSAVKRRRDAR